MRARVVGDLPVALGIDEMMRQVRSLQLAVTGVYVDGEGTKIGDCPSAPATAEKEPSKSFLTTDISFYNKQIIGLVGESPNSDEPMQSPVDLKGAKEDPDLGPISFYYTPIWATDPQPWSPGALSGTVVSPQPTVVRNTGLSWEVEVARHHQMTIPVQGREDGGEPSEVVLPMEDLTGVEGGVGEDAVDQDLQRKHFFRIGLAVLVQMLVTAALVLAVNYGLETSVRSSMVETFACQIIGAVLICAAWMSAELRLVTAWPLGIIYLIVPCVSFGIIFGAISITYADASSFLVPTGFSCGFFVVANFALFWFSTGKHFVNLNGWLISFGDASLSDDWVVVAMSIYMDFALVSVLRCLILF